MVGGAASVPSASVYHLVTDDTPSRASSRALTASMSVCAVFASFATALFVWHSSTTAAIHLGLVRDPLISMHGETQPVCVFIHGAGVHLVSEPSSEYRDYWGSLHERLRPRCASLTFMHEDTLHVGWQDDLLQRRVCEIVGQGAAAAAALSVPLVVFAHSLGNVLLAGMSQSAHQP